jgi:hypothetical protein
MNKLEKRFLSRRGCFLCEARLDQDVCGAIGDRCSKEMMEKRRRDALKTYKPRRPRLNPGQR